MWHGHRKEESMKNLMKIATLASVLGAVSVSSLFAQAAGGGIAKGSATTTSRESEVYAQSTIHHYASNGGASTVTVFVPSHYSFKTGQYVMVPSYYAEAPLPHDKYFAAYWVSTTTSESGHWAKN